jgi:exodeoxyribonuclease VII small subunit
METLENSSIPADIAAMNFEQSLHALEEIVRRLESGQTTLENSIADYTRGTILKEHCSQKLRDARLKVEKIISKADGSVTTENFAVAE